MDSSLYLFLTGPGLYISLAVFFIGLGARFVLYFMGLDWKLERIGYKSDLPHGLKGGLHSAFSWLIPFGTRGWRAQPFMASAFFLLHFGAVLVPLFLIGHNVILREKFGFSLPSLPQPVTDVLTVMSIVGLLLLILRRIALAEVRILSGWLDYGLLLLVLALFVSGFFATQGIGVYECCLLGHIFLGELLLILAPFTKMSHIALYFASRIQIGMDFAIKRGGYNRKSGPYFPW